MHFKNAGHESPLLPENFRKSTDPFQMHPSHFADKYGPRKNTNYSRGTTGRQHNKGSRSQNPKASSKQVAFFDLTPAMEKPDSRMPPRKKRAWADIQVPNYA